MNVLDVGIRPAIPLVDGCIHMAASHDSKFTGAKHINTIPVIFYHMLNQKMEYYKTRHTSFIILGPCVKVSPFRQPPPCLITKHKLRQPQLLQAELQPAGRGQRSWGQGCEPNRHSHGKIHHFSWENSLFQWPFSIAMLNNHQRVPYIVFFFFWDNLDN